MLKVKTATGGEDSVNALHIVLITKDAFSPGAKITLTGGATLFTADSYENVVDAAHKALRAIHTR